MRMSNLHKMLSKTCLIILLVNFVSDYSYGQRDKKFFRKDYTYIEGSEGFYKIHTLQKTWSDAKRMCALEGASLFYPETSDEANAVISFWDSTQTFESVYVGISDIVVEGVFETIHGQAAADVYDKWGAGEPNNADGNEDCVILRKDGTLNDIPCDKKNPFICKKTLLSLEWNQQCHIPDLGYLYNGKVSRCYKFHSTPMSWTDAFSVCSAEQSYLAVINTQKEADALAWLAENYTKNRSPGKVMCGTVHLGFHNKFNDGWQTIKGTSLDDTGYVKWSPNQPDDEDGKKCGAMSYTGLLNDISCDTKCYFICEHEVDTLGSLLVNRFGGAQKLS